MPTPLILASASEIRARLLRKAGVEIRVEPARTDEETTRAAMIAEGAAAGDIAEALAAEKARKISLAHPVALVLGCDQVAAFQHDLLSKPPSPKAALTQLRALSGHKHYLYSAAILMLDGAIIWRFVGKVSLQMHDLSEVYIKAYIDRNWHSIQHSVGSYKLEEEGVRLFSAVRGDYFHVLGLPLIELLSYLTERGELER